ncbi:hypothetical protein AHiyo6_11780, partial [Arthrobacter sp. Hiyo6]
MPVVFPGTGSIHDPVKLFIHPEERLQIRQPVANRMIKCSRTSCTPLFAAVRAAAAETILRRTPTLTAA